MKLLLVNSFTRGGAARSCVRLHRGLRAGGQESNLLTLWGDPLERACHALRTGGGPLPVRVWHRLREDFQRRRHQRLLTGLPPGYEGFSFPESVHDVTRHPLHHRADLINLHWVTGMLDWRTFFRRTSQPVVWTLHDMYPFSGGYPFREGFPVEEYRGLIRQNLDRQRSALRGSSLTVVAPSRWLLGQSRASELFGRFRHELIPYGVDTAVFRPHPMEFARDVLGLPRGGRVILFVADAVDNRRKGFSILMESLGVAAPTGVTCAVVGKGSPAGVTVALAPLGRIGDDRLLALAYAAADLFVLPSVEDNLPNTAIESICCGTPVVGFDVGGVPDIVTDGLNGFLCRSVEPGELARTLERALGHRFDREAIRRDAVDRFGQELQAGRYLDLFRDILGDRPGERSGRGGEAARAS
jgi:glycosyltransferase involved in cell wall biosynthesis